MVVVKVIKGKFMNQKVLCTTESEATCLEPLYVILKVDLQQKKCDCVYSQDQVIYEEDNTTDSYGAFINRYVTVHVYEFDRKKVKEFLSIEFQNSRLSGGCMEEELFYRRVESQQSDAYVWVKAIRHIDENEHTAMITLHQERGVYPRVLSMKQELDKKEKAITRQYWDTVSLLSNVLEHNQLKEADQQDRILYKTNLPAVTKRLSGIWNHRRRNRDNRSSGTDP